MSRIPDILARKRSGLALSGDDIRQMVAAITDASASDAQIGAFAMAVYLNGMNADERLALTLAMRDSGTSLVHDLPGPVLDKHSTGGIGDTVSLVLAPALAACGGYVPMISGRGLGHTGGTLDKLDAIEGYDTAPDLARFRTTLRKAGCAIIGQTANLAPADKRLYAIRDETRTVDSLDLICASILSKKLASGLDALVLDVKCGNGAFMTDLDDAMSLAQTLVDVANGAGCATRALLTDMDAPLAPAAGNAIETRLALQFLAGTEIDSRLWDITLALGGALLTLSGLAANDAEGAQKISDALQSGAAADRFGEMATCLGAPADLMEHPDRYLASAPVIRDVEAGQQGFVSRIDTRALGEVVIGLGGGRDRADDIIDPAVGLDWLLGTAMLTDEDTPLVRIHARTTEEADAAAKAVRAAYVIADTPPEDRPLILRSLP